MKTTLYNQKGEKLKEIELPKEVFELEVNSDLVHQVLLSQQSNQRQGSAKTKDRGEVRGGGRKPWRQKEPEEPEQVRYVLRFGKVGSYLWSKTA